MLGLSVNELLDVLWDLVGGLLGASWRQFLGSFGSLLEHLLGILDASWGVMGASSGPLGASWGPLGASFGPLGAED